MPSLTADRLSFAFRAKSGSGRRRRDLRWALRDVTLEVGRGSTLGVVGDNGAGKTTLLLCLAGVLTPTGGAVTASGRVVALVDLTAGFSRELTGYENAIVIGVLSGMSRQEVRAAFPAVASFSGLDGEMLSAPLRTYSAGMILRLGAAIALHASPSVLLIDEVVAFADPEFRARLGTALSDFRRRGGSVVIAGQDQSFIEEHADDVLVLDRGTVVSVGRARDALAAYRAVERSSVLPADRRPAWRARA